MPESVTRVAYEAIADFSQLHMAAEGAITDLDRLKAKEAELNAASITGAEAAKAASAARVKAMQDEVSAQNTETAATKVHQAAVAADTEAEKASAEAKKTVKFVAKEAADAIDGETDSKKKNSEVTKSLAGDVGALGKAFLGAVTGIFKHKEALDADTKSAGAFRTAWRQVMTDLKDTESLATGAGKFFDNLGTGLQKIFTAGNGAGGTWPVMLLVPLILGILAVVNPAVAGLSAIGAAAIGLAANLGSLVGLLAAAPALISAFVTSLDVLKISFKGVGTAVTAWEAVQNGTGTLKAYQQALDKLTPAQKDFVKWLESMSGAWKNFKNVVTDNFFSAFRGDLGKIGPVFAAITNIMGQAATAVGKVVDGIIKLAAQPAFVGFLNQFAGENAAMIGVFGKVLGDVLDIIMKITQAAAPLARSLGDSFGKMADNLDRIVSTAAGNGSLTKWLGDVYQNLHLWWGIVSDIAKTIINYSTAASGFGTWITEGLKKVTDGWLANSEAAMKPGSTFQKWLGDVAPLVKELAHTVGDLLHWWTQVTENPNNISKMLSMLQTINDTLGPALGNLFQTMANTQIGPDLISLITNLVVLIDTILSHGGAQVIEQVIYFLAGVVQFAAQLAQVPGVAPALVAIAAALGTLSALSLANKFVPILDMVAALLRLAAKESALTKIFNGLTGYKGAATAETAATTAGTDAGVYATAGGVGGTVLRSVPIVAAAAAGAKGVIDAAPDINSSVNDLLKAGGTNATFSDNKKLRDRANTDIGNVIGDTIMPAGLKGALDTFAPGFSSGVRKNVSNFAKGGAGAEEDFVKGAGKALGNGADQLGAGAASTGKAVAGVFDAKNWQNGANQIGDFFTKTLPDKASHGLKQIGDFFAPIGKSFDHGAKQIGDFFTKDLPKGFEHGSKQIGDFFTKDLPKSFEHGSKQIGDFFTKTLPFAAGFASSKISDFFTKTLPKAADHGAKQIGDFFGGIGKSFDHGGKQIGDWFTKTLPKDAEHGSKQMGDFLGGIGKSFDHGGQQISDWFTKTLPTAAQHGLKQIGDFFDSAGKTIWKALGDAGKWIGEQSARFNVWLTVDVPNFFKSAGTFIWTALKDAGEWLKKVGDQIWTWISVTVPKLIGDGAKSIWNLIPTIDVWISEQAGALANWLGGIGKQIANAFSSGVSAAQNNTPAPAHLPGQPGHHQGGTIYRSFGGGVPGTGDADTVPAMLTPGEVVIRKGIVDLVGEQNLLDLNAGLMSYQDLLTRSMQMAPNKNKSVLPTFMSGAGLSGTSAPALPSYPSGQAWGSPNSSSSGSKRAGLHVENLNVINPVPERTSDSLPRTLRKMSYLAMAKG